MYKDYRYINAGENEIYRWGKKAQAKILTHLEPNQNGYYSIPVDGDRYWTIGTSKGKYGEFAKIKGICFSVNSYWYMWAKEGTEKAEAFKDALNSMIDYMKKIKDQHSEYTLKKHSDSDDDDYEIDD